MVGERLRGGVLVEIRLARQRGCLHALLRGVEQIVRHVAQVSGALFLDVRLERAAGSRQPVDGVLGLGLLALTVGDEAALIRLPTLVAGGGARRSLARRDGVGVGDPAAHFVSAGKGFFGQVFFHKQALIVAIAGIRPTAVDARQRNGVQWHAAGAGQEGLHGSIVAVVVLHARAGFDLHHAPLFLANG